MISLSSDKNASSHVNSLDVDARLAELTARGWGKAAEATRRLEGAGFTRNAPPTWDTLPRIPILHKTSLAALQRSGPDLGGFVTTDVATQAWFSSPGGVIEPMVRRQVERLGDLLRDAGFEPGDRVLNGFAYHLTPAGLLFHQALIHIGVTVLPIGPQQKIQAAELAARVGATGFVGVASHLALLMEEIDALSADFTRPTLRLAVAGGEPFGDPVRRQIKARWGITCLDLYGVAEAGVFAIECPQNNGPHVHAEPILEFVDPVTGERVTSGEVGELVLTLDSDELPLLRLGTGDLVRLEMQACVCGRATPRLRLLGRIGDSARVRAMLLHASQLRAFAQRAGVAACRAVITRDGGADYIVVHWRHGIGAQAPTDEALAEAFRNVCRLRADRFSEDPTLQEGDISLLDKRDAA